jgi:hypothetical protein
VSTRLLGDLDAAPTRAEFDRLAARVKVLEEYLSALAPLPVADPGAMERPGPVVYPTRAQEA